MRIWLTDSTQLNICIENEYNQESGKNVRWNYEAHFDSICNNRSVGKKEKKNTPINFYFTSRSNPQFSSPFFPRINCNSKSIPLRCLLAILSPCFSTNAFSVYVFFSPLAHRTSYTHRTGHAVFAPQLANSRRKYAKSFFIIVPIRSKLSSFSLAIVWYELEEKKSHFIFLVSHVLNMYNALLLG